MRLLLDTHAFLWFIEGSTNLSERARKLIEDADNQRFLSIASIWEIAIKVSLNKLELKMTLSELVKQQVRGNAIEVLEIEPEHLDILVSLPFYHKDPFDRLIIAQSLTDELPILSKDTAFHDYSVRVLW